MRRTSVAVAAFAFLALAALALAQDKAASSGGASAAASPRRAILVRGASSVKGLPFFPPNAMAALSGAYRPQGAADAADEVSVWYTREAVVLGGAWKRAALAGYAAFSLERPRGPVLALRTPSYSLFFELPAALDSGERAFITAFDRKFPAFFENAATAAELSFPAYVEY
jgi:hypothetical protein